MKSRNLVLKISFIALTSALIFIATSFIAIPYGGGIGYFNLSDGIILFSTIYLGPVVGLFSAIIGCSLGDLYAGFASAIPFTILAKSLESIAIFLIYGLLRKTKYIKYTSYFIAPLFMVISYIPYYLLYDNGQGIYALISSAFDLIQAFAGGVIGLTLSQLFYRVNLPSSYIKENLFFKDKQKEVAN